MVLPQRPIHAEAWRPQYIGSMPSMPATPHQSEKFLVLEGMRGVAAMFVAVRHTFMWWGSVSFGESFLAVDLFFLLSGLVLAHAYERRITTGAIGVGRFMGRRLLRIYPLYVIGTMIGLACTLTWPDPPAPPIDNFPLTTALGLLMVPSDVISGQDFYPFDYPSWSLFFELVANLIFVIVVPVLTPVRLAAVCIFAYAVFTMGMLLHGSGDLGYYHDDLAVGLARVVFPFFLGVLLARHLGRLQAWLHGLPPLAVPLVLVTAACLAPTFDSARLRVVHELVMIAAGFPLLVAVGVSVRVRPIEAPALTALGVLSFPLFVLHAPVGETLRLLLLDRGVDVTAWAPWSGLVLLIGLTILAWAVGRYVDQPLRSAIETAIRQWRRGINPEAPVARSNE